MVMQWQVPQEASLYYCHCTSSENLQDRAFAATAAGYETGRATCVETEVAFT